MTLALRALPLVVLPILPARPAMAAGQAPTDTVTLNPVVVTATRIPTLAAAVPAAVTVLRGAELREQGIATVLEALREVPGAAVVQTGSFGGQTALFVRGGQSNYTKVLVDGVAVNQPGGAFDFAHLTTDNVERIEIVRGPTSVLYGSDAVTGVVQIFTRRANGPARADARVRGGTYGTLAWDAETMGGTETASYSLSASRFATSGLYPFNNDYRNTVFSGLMRFAPDSGTDAIVSLRYDDNVYHFPTDGSGDTVAHNQFNYESGPAIGVDVGHSFTPRLDARLLLAAHETDGGYDKHPDSPSDTLGFYAQTLDHVRRASADLRANLHVGAVTVLTGGAAFETESQRGFDASQSRYGNTTVQRDVRRHNAAYYLQAVTDLAQRASVTVGARLEDNERFGTYATVRAGGTYHLRGGTRIRVSAGNAFREPAFFENYSTGFTVGNPNLRPEHSRSWEVGLEQSLERAHALVSATVFDQRFVDMIDYNPNAAAGAPNYDNVAAATANGVELGARVLLLEPLWVTASYTYLRTRVSNPGFDSSSGALLATGQPLVRRPRHSAHLDAGWHLRERGTVSLAATYVGDRQDRIFPPFPAPPQRVTLPSYVRLDLAAELDLVPPRAGAPGFAISGRVENLLDHAYEEVKNFPARGRTVLVGGELRFGSR